MFDFGITRLILHRATLLVNEDLDFRDWESRSNAAFLDGWQHWMRPIGSHMDDDGVPWGAEALGIIAYDEKQARASRDEALDKDLPADCAH